MEDLTDRFVSALEKLHQDRDVEPLVELFSDDATLNKAGVPHGESGQDGARVFWLQYRDVFNDIASDFTHRVVGDDLAYLEWTSRGSLRDGHDFEYEGVSVLESHGDTIEAFRTYYDTAAFLVAAKN